MRVRTAINLLLALEMALALLSLVVCTAFALDWPLLERVDRSIKDARVRAPQHTLELIRGEPAPATAIVALEQLLDQLSGVQKTDAAQATRRAAFAEVVSRLRGEQAFDRALAWCAAWVAFDALDLQAQAECASLRMLDPLTRNDGIQTLDRLRDRFPESLPLASIRAGAYGQLGALKEAFAAFAPFLQGPSTASPLIRQIGMPVNHPPELRFLGLRGDAPRYAWFPDRERWRLVIDPGASYERLRLRFLQPEALDVHLIDASAAVTVQAFGAEERGERRYRKSDYANATLIIEGAARQFVLEMRIAAPPTLEILLSPGVRPLLSAQLAGDEALMALLDDARGRYAQDR